MLTSRGSILALALLAACQTHQDDRMTATDSTPTSGMMAADSSAADTALVGADWTLVALGGQAAPMGNGGRPATLTFLTEASRVGGFAGCNRVAGSYTLNGANLTFGPLVMTKMACVEGMDLEQRFAAALDSTRTMRHVADTLELMNQQGSVLARFERHPN